MDYNKSVKQTVIPFIVKEIFEKIDAESDSWSLTVNSYKTRMSKQSYDYFRNENKSCLIELEVNYTVKPKDPKAPKNETRNETVSVFIPQLVKSSFIIDGKARTHESYFDKGNELNINKDYINFKGFTYRIPDNTISFWMRGVGRQVLPLEDINSPEKFEHKEFSELLKLSERQRKMVRIVYDFDPGKKITIEALQRMRESFKDTMRDHVVTKQLITVDRAFMMHMEKCRWKLVRNISAQFYKAGNVYVSNLQSTIYNFFKARSESVNSVHFPDNMNELSYLIASKKVILETGNDYKKKLKVSKTRYNHTFFDVVDSAVSPDGPNINKKNELAQAVEVNADGSINMKVYDKNFNEISIELLDYMLGRVLHYQEVDYIRNKVRDPKKKNKKLKYKGQIMEGSDYDYIDLHPDERLATTSRQIPMMNSCDSIRVAMASKMVAQTISTRTSEPPLIATGHENIKDNSPLALTWKSETPGKVIKSDKFSGEIEIETKDKDGKPTIKKVRIPSSIQSQKNISINFIPAQVGQVLKPGDLVYRSNNMAEDGQLRLGQNLRTAFMYWRGLEFEDSVVISESAANQMITYGETTIEYNIKPGEDLNKVVVPGQMVSSVKGDYLVSVNRELSYTKAQEGLNNLVRVQHKYTKEVGFKVPSNVVNAIVADVQYVEFIRDEAIKERLDSVVKLNYKTNPNSEYLKFKTKFGEPDNMRKLEKPSEFDKSQKKGVAYKVFIKLSIAYPCKNGDKVSNRYGSKGVISAVVPDSEMPRTKDGEIIEIVINPSSVIARKNLPQTSEAILSKVSEEMWVRVDNMPKGTDKEKQVIRDLFSKYHFDWLASMKWGEFMKYHESLRNKRTKYQVRTGAFSPYSPKRVSEIQEELDIKDKITLIDGKRGREIKSPIMVGYTYILKLHHMSEFPNKITPENPRDRNPLPLGLGDTREDGQVIGEMESTALLTHGVNGYLKEVRGNAKSDWFLANMILSSQVVVDSKGKALLTEVSNVGKSKANYR